MHTHSPIQEIFRKYNQDVDDKSLKLLATEIDIYPGALINTYHSISRIRFDKRSLDEQDLVNDKHFSDTELALSMMDIEKLSRLSSNSGSSQALRFICLCYIHIIAHVGGRRHGIALPACSAALCLMCAPCDKWSFMRYFCDLHSHEQVELSVVAAAAVSYLARSQYFTYAHQYVADSLDAYYGETGLDVLEELLG